MVVGDRVSYIIKLRYIKITAHLFTYTLGECRRTRAKNRRRYFDKSKQFCDIIMMTEICVRII